MVTFLVPPSPFLLDQRVFMTLGVLRVAAAIKDLTDVQVFEPRGEVDYASIPESDIIAFTATTPQMPEVMKMLDHVSKYSTTVLGGPHATLVNASIQSGSSRASGLRSDLLKRFDALVYGDGEFVMRRLVEETRGGVPPEAREYDADDRRRGFWIHNLDDLPFPDRSLVDVDSYRYEIDGTRAMSLISQLGCPFNCGFCGGRSSAMLRRIRRRSTQSVVAEMRHLHETYGTTAFMFYDDELNVNKSLIELCLAIQELQMDLGVDFKLRGFIKAELFSIEQAETMAKTGFKSLLCGFESGSPRILKNINKKATIDDNTRVIERCKRFGIKIKALMSLGHPGETWVTAKATEDWLYLNQPDDVDISLITPYPGSPYYDQAKWNGYCWEYETNGDKQFQLAVDFHRDSSFYKGVPGTYRSAVATPRASAGALVRARDRMEDQVRTKLGLPPLNPAQRAFESSMGQ